MNTCLRWMSIVAALTTTTLTTATVSGGEVEVAASKATPDASGKLLWYKAQDIGVEGKAWTDTKAFFDRLPARAEKQVRPPVWGLSRHSAGICLRFVTNADTIRVRWTLTSSSLAMPHMPATGVSGVDLYVKHKQRWRWLSMGRPSARSNDVKLTGSLGAVKRQYLLYLPLYNGVQSLEVGVPKNATLARVTLDSAVAKPLVFWGTSITQGGCASRTGMVHTAILGRRLGRPVINLGFSGNGRLEPEVAKLIAEIDASVFILDCLPNLTGAQTAERIEPVIRILRIARPHTPILLVEDRTYANAFLLPNLQQRNEGNRKALRAAYQRLKKDIKGLHYLEGEKLLGDDGEDTVDGSHPTDLGFQRQADAFESVLRPILAASTSNDSK